MPNGGRKVTGCHINAANGYCKKVAADATDYATVIAVAAI